jgi:hypothetical protein
MLILLQFQYDGATDGIFNEVMQQVITYKNLNFAAPVQQQK